MQTTTFTLTIDNGTSIAQKNYSDLSTAELIVKRYLSLAKRAQEYYNGVQVLNYISIDTTEVNHNNEVVNVLDYNYYFCGSKL